MQGEKIRVKLIVSITDNLDQNVFSREMNVREPFLLLDEFWLKVGNKGLVPFHFKEGTKCWNEDTNTYSVTIELNKSFLIKPNFLVNRFRGDRNWKQE